MLIYKDCIDESEGLQYICDPCEITEGGGVRSLCLLKKGTTIPNPYTQLDIDILVGAGLLYVMAETRGNFDGGTPKIVTGYGDKKERQIGTDYVLQVKDPTFADNYDFWQAVENIEDWNIAFRTETQLAVVSDDVTITTKAPAEEGLDTEVVWDIECKWYSKNKPQIQPYSGKFDNILKTLDVIYGGTIATGGVINLTIDAGKTGYVRLPNGTVLTTNGSGVIDTTYSGVGGAITYYVPKNSTIAAIENSGLTGAITTNFVGIIVIEGSNGITGLTAPYSIQIGCRDMTLLTNLVAPHVLGLAASGSALTAKNIGDILYQAYIEQRDNVVFDFSGGNNAYYGLIDSYLNDNYNGLTLSEVETAISGLGGVLTIEP